MSGGYPNLLKRRASSMMKLAERLLHEGEYDLAVLNAEYATQLYIKSLLYRLSGEEWRGHSVRTLLGALALVAEENGLKRVAERIYDYVRRSRRILAELDEAHTRSIYGVFEYSRGQAETLVSAARSIIKLVKEIEDDVFRGGS
ncbi:MAG: HEPN domain-containing protein [Thermoproteales archaeon]|nr:HEPN domain-containing protein [Thermoproteales archaeon]RLE65952.1 MAG: DNA-binding protein [Thermoprotei archaeon]